jgi:hypothetical protein
MSIRALPSTVTRYVTTAALCAHRYVGSRPTYLAAPATVRDGAPLPAQHLSFGLGGRTYDPVTETLCPSQRLLARPIRIAAGGFQLLTNLALAPLIGLAALLTWATQGRAAAGVLLQRQGMIACLDAAVSGGALMMVLPVTRYGI